MEQHVLDQARKILEELVADFEAEGLIFTVERVPRVGEPLAMGNHKAKVTVYEKRLTA